MILFEKSRSISPKNSLCRITLQPISTNPHIDRPWKTDRFGGSSIDAVWSRFILRSMILSVIRRSFHNASFRASGLSLSVTGMG